MSAGLALAAACLTAISTATATELSYFQTFTNVDYASSGIGGIREIGYGSINLTNLAGANPTILHAYLYWHGHGQSSDYDATRTTGTCYLTPPNGAGAWVTGTLIGTSGSDGWAFSPYNQTFGQAFRADVTSLISGNGAYFISNFTPFALSVQGASLVVIYDDGVSTNNRDIVIEDGCDQNSPNSYDANGWNISFPGVNYTQGDMVGLEFHVSDGQCQYLEGAMYLNGQLLAPTGTINTNFQQFCPANPLGLLLTNGVGKLYGQIFEGDAPYDPSSGFRYSFFTGSLWDVKSFNIVPFLSSGVNNLYITSDYVDDDLTVVAVVAKLKSGGATSGNVTNHPPTVVCPSDVANTLLAGILFNNQGNYLVSDPDGDALTVTWRLGGAVISQTNIPAGLTSNGVSVALSSLLSVPGNYAIGVTVQDSKGATVNCSSLITLSALLINTYYPPNASDDATNTMQGSPVTVTVLSNDSDANSPALPLSVIGATTPQHGSVVVTAAGTIIYTPNRGFSGTDTFQYTLSNGKGTDVANVTISVVPLVQSPPIAVLDTAATLAGTAVTIPVLLNDSDTNYPNPLLFGIASYTQPATGGSVTQSGTNFVFTPTAGFIGLATFNYSITNTAGLSSSATVSVTVSATTQYPPSAKADTASTTAGVPVTVSVLTNDTDGNTPPLAIGISTFTQPATGGSVSLSGSTLVFTPASGFTGTATFNYSITNTSGLSSTASVTVTVTGSTSPYEGCSLGFWKNHASLWNGGAQQLPGVSYTTCMYFNTVFGVSSTKSGFSNTTTLLQVLGTGGGGLNALGRQVVAAILNAQSVNYPLSVATIISRYKVAVGTTTCGRGTTPDTVDGLQTELNNDNNLEGSLCNGVTSITLGCANSTAALGAAYSSGFPVSGGVPGYTFMVTSGSLPPGLTLNASSGSLTGTPTKSGTYSFTIRVADSIGLGCIHSAATCCSITVNCLPSPWKSCDVGHVGSCGNGYCSGSTHNVCGSGSDIWGCSDEFHYDCQPASGDCTIVCRVKTCDNTDPWAKCGIMVRESLTDCSRHASIVCSPGNGVVFQCRNTTGGWSSSCGGSDQNSWGCGNSYGWSWGSNNSCWNNCWSWNKNWNWNYCNSGSKTTSGGVCWLKITRRGSTFTACRSTDGSNWTTIGCQNITMASNVYFGLCVTSHSDGDLCNASFDNVTLTP